MSTQVMPPARVSRANSLTMELVVVKRVVESSGVVSFELEDLRRDPLPWWSPGAHLDVTTPAGHVRQYSLCGDYGVSHTWRIGVLREADGRGGSVSMHDDVKVGDVLTVRLPRNNFALARADRYLFLAGGIGITPILAMTRAAERRGATWSLVYAGRTRDTMAFRESIETFGGDVRIVPEDEEGRPLFEDLIDGIEAGTQIYCCGPAGMIAAVQRSAARRGDVTLHIERFSAVDLLQEDLPPNEPFDVILAHSGESIHVAADKTMLEALEQHGVPSLSSCREGMCGSCEIAVLAGTPLHRDFVLTNDERASGEWMLPCVSRCIGDEITVAVDTAVSGAALA